MTKTRVGYVAVYGTLKGGHRANYMLGHDNFMGKGRTQVRYKMTDVGFPMIEVDRKGHFVNVEVYSNPHWPTLDNYEGVPDLYGRRVVNIKMEDGSVERAYIYEATEIMGEAVEPIDNRLNWG